MNSSSTSTQPIHGPSFGHLYSYTTWANTSLEILWLLFLRPLTNQGTIPMSPMFHLTHWILVICCLLLSDKAGSKYKTYIWVSVWWKTKNSNWGIYVSHMDWVVWGIGTPNNRDEFNRREFCECDGWVCDLDTTGTPSTFKIICIVVTLVRIFPHLDFGWEENTTWW
jgi:hypothetical protein